MKNELVKQYIDLLTNGCEALKKLYIKSNEEIDIEILLNLEKFKNFIKDLTNEIK